MNEPARPETPDVSVVRIAELDAFRGLAAFFVVLFHCAMFRPQSDYGFFLGVTGVDLFFMISGFVIFSSLERSRNIKDFILARFIRLFPVYWIVSTFTFLVYYWLNSYDGVIPYTEISGSTYLVNLTMVQYYFNVPNISGSYWTLIIELLFYFFIAVIFVMGGLKHVVWIGLAIATGSLIWVVFAADETWLSFSAWFPLLSHLPLFITGILFYQLYTGKIGWHPALWLIPALMLVQLVLAPFGRAVQFTGYSWYAIMLIVYCAFFSLFIGGKLKFIAAKITRFLGDISYTLYLIHQPLCYGLILPYFVDIRQYNFWLVTWLMALPVTFLLAAVITYTIEFPLRKYLRKAWLNRS